MIGRLITAMIEEYRNLRYVEHALKVYAYASAIGQESGLSAEEQRILEAAAVLHDIGIPRAVELHGSGAGPFQEKEGVVVAEPMLMEAGFPKEDAPRVLSLIGRHHTPEAAEGDALLRMLMEADYLVNLAEGNLPGETPHRVLEAFFRTPAAIRYMQALYIGGN